MRRRGYARFALAVVVAAVAIVARAEEWSAAVGAGDYERARAALERALRATPDNTSLRYELARVLGYSGSTEAALAQFDALLARYPDNADYLLGRAQMLARLGRDAEALEATARALRLAPDYEDVWRLRLRLAERSTEPALTAVVRREIEARYPAADWWRRAPAEPDYRRSLSLGLSDERLSSPLPGWSQRFVRVDWRTPAGGALFGELYRDERFGRTDVSANAGLSWRVLPEWRLGGAFGAAANADFEPTRELALDAQRSFGGAWGTELQYRRREYDGAAVSTYSFTGDRYLAEFRVAYRVSYSRLHGASSSMGHALVLAWYPTDMRSLGVTLGAGEEIERVQLDDLLRTRVSSVTLTGHEALSARWALNWWLGTHEQGDFYRRRYAGLAIRVGF